jgi:hypothetical protein
MRFGARGRRQAAPLGGREVGQFHGILHSVTTAIAAATAEAPAVAVKMRAMPAEP